MLLSSSSHYYHHDLNYFLNVLDGESKSFAITNKIEQRGNMRKTQLSEKETLSSERGQRIAIQTTTNEHEHIMIDSK